MNWWVTGLVHWFETLPPRKQEIVMVGIALAALLMLKAVLR